MKKIVISVDKLHELQFDEDYTEYIRGWNDAIDQVLVDGEKSTDCMQLACAETAGFGKANKTMD